MKESFAEEHMYNTATVKGGKLRPVLLCGKISYRCEKSLRMVGVEPVHIPSFHKLSVPVSEHPDMLFFPKGDGALLTFSEYSAENPAFFSRLEALGVKVSLTNHAVFPGYPRDIGLNALSLSGVLFARLDSVCREILDMHTEKVNVRQGYTRCSVCVLSQSHVITADPGLAKALDNFCEVLLIRPGYIELPGYDYGFIGGAALPLPGNSVGFCGNVLSHPDGDRILCFAEHAGVQAVCLSDEPLYDSGGGILTYVSASASSCLGCISATS